MTNNHQNKKFEISSMVNIYELRHKRLNYKMNEMGKYSRLIINDHFSIILLVLLAFGVMYYQELASIIESLPYDSTVWPIRFILFLICVILFRNRPVRWLTVKTDESFLFSRGIQWKKYWLKGMIIPIIISVLLISGFSAIIFPYVVRVSYWKADQYWLFNLLCILLNIILTYHSLLNAMTKIKFNRINDVIMSCIFTIVLLVPNKFALIGSVGILFVLSLFAWFRQTNSSNKIIDFEYVIDLEEYRESQRYKWLSIFADVPTVKPKIVRRAWLDPLLEKMSPKKNDRYSFLYLRTLFRNQAYSLIWLRVLLFISILLCIISKAWLQISLGIIGHIMTAVQLFPLVFAYTNNPFQQIYSVQMEPTQYFGRSLRIILFFQTIVYSLISRNVIGLIIWCVFAELIIRFYLPKWYEKNSKKRH